MYSVQQVELVRRLRSTGLNREQVVDIFDSLEKLDKEMQALPKGDEAVVRKSGPVDSEALNLCNRDAENNNIKQEKQMSPRACGTTTSTPYNSFANLNGAAEHTPHNSFSAADKVKKEAEDPKVTAFRDTLEQANKLKDALSGASSTKNLIQSMMENLRKHQSLLNNAGLFPHTRSAFPQFPSAPIPQLPGSQQQALPTPPAPSQQPSSQPSSLSSSAVKVRFNRKWNNEFSIPEMEAITDDSPAMQRFLMQGTQECYNCVWRFVQAYGIKQHQVAAIVNLSQSYVSRFLKGDYMEMSDRCRRAFYRFYLAFERCPALIAGFASAIEEMRENENQQQHHISSAVADHPALAAAAHQSVEMQQLFAASQMNQDGGAAQDEASCGQLNSNEAPSGGTQMTATLDMARKRDRFVFRPPQTALLERYYAIDRYPSNQKREEIRHQLNELTKSELGERALNLTQVTFSVVTNWFANRRKSERRTVPQPMPLLPATGGAATSAASAQTQLDDISSSPPLKRGRPSRLDLMRFQMQQDSFNKQKEMKGVDGEPPQNGPDSSTSEAAAATGGGSMPANLNPLMADLWRNPALLQHFVTSGGLQLPFQNFGMHLNGSREDDASSTGSGSDGGDSRGATDLSTGNNVTASDKLQTDGPIFPVGEEISNDQNLVSSNDSGVDFAAPTHKNEGAHSPPHSDSTAEEEQARTNTGEPAADPEALTLCSDSQKYEITFNSSELAAMVS